MRTLPTLFVVLLALPVRGQAPQPAPAAEEGGALPSQLTLPEALRLFRERGLDLLLADAIQQSAVGDAEIAGAVQNPSLTGSIGRSFNYDPRTCPECSALQLGVGLSDNAALFDLLVNKRGLRKEVAAAAITAAKLSRQDAQRTLEFQLKQQFLVAALAKEQLDFAHETQSTTARTRALNQRKLQAGAISEADLAKTDVQDLEAGRAADQAQQQLVAATAAVAFLLGAQRPQPELRLDTSALEYRGPGALGELNAAGLFETALSTRPDLLALDQQVKRAEAALRLVERSRIPQAALSLNYAQEGTGGSSIQPPTLTLGVQLSGLPIFYQQQGEVHKAQADLRLQLATRSRTRAQIAADVQSAFAGLRTGRSLIDRMKGEMLNRARRARDLVQVQYEKGAASLFDLLDAERTYIAVHGEYLQDLSVYWTAVAQLEQAVGKELHQ